MVKQQTAAHENRFLARLPKHDLERLLPLLRPVTLAFDQTIYESRGPIEYAYFPTGSVFSALTIMEGGAAIEVASIGNEGLVGHSVATGGMRSPNRVILQIPGGALRAEVRVLRSEAARGGAFKDLLGAYQETYMAQVSQSVACNGLHTLEKRCCRWLLMTRDRVGSDELRLTHEFLAIMLGVRRASVTEVLKPLQEEALILSHRGTVSILDGARLEARSCECYRVVKEDYDRLLDGPLH
jgi:CRP-like cAMP-binding protein